MVNTRTTVYVRVHETSEKLGPHYTFLSGDRPIHQPSIHHKKISCIWKNNVLCYLRLSDDYETLIDSLKRYSWFVKMKRSFRSLHLSRTVGSPLPEIWYPKSFILKSPLGVKKLVESKPMTKRGFLFGDFFLCDIHQTRDCHSANFSALSCPDDDS